MSLRHIAAVASVFKTGTDWLREKCVCLNYLEFSDCNIWRWLAGGKAR